VYKSIPKGFRSKLNLKLYSKEEVKLVLDFNNPCTVIILLLLLHFMLEYLRCNNSPYFKKYVRTLKDTIRFYKIIKHHSRHDDKLEKTVKRTLEKILARMETSEAQGIRAKETTDQIRMML